MILHSSLVQSVTINPDMTMTALGKKAKMAHFRVHKVSAGIRMFESIAHPGKYIRMKEGIIDCMVSQNCQAEYSQTAINYMTRNFKITLFLCFYVPR